jgi:hypothetical protein
MTNQNVKNISLGNEQQLGEYKHKLILIFVPTSRDHFDICNLIFEMN